LRACQVHALHRINIYATANNRIYEKRKIIKKHKTLLTTLRN